MKLTYKKFDVETVLFSENIRRLAEIADRPITTSNSGEKCITCPYHAIDTLLQKLSAKGWECTERTYS